MKILFLFLLLTACMARVYSQSTLPLRADTVVIEKVGGNANLKLKDASRDTLGGILTNIGGGVYRGKKPRKLNDSMFIVGNDTLKILGGRNNNVYNMDSTLAANRTITQAGRYLRFQQSSIDYTQYNGALQTIQTDSTSVPFYIKVIKSPYAGTPADGMVEWREGVGFGNQAPSRPNYPFMRGWNLAAGGSAFVPGLPALGESWEPHYLPDVGSPTLWLMEHHLYYIQPNGTQRRLESWTINTRDNNWNKYQVVPAWSLRDTFSVDYLSASTASATDRTTVVEHKAGNSTTRTQFISNGTEDLFQIKSLSLGQLEFEGFTNIDFGAGDGFDVTNDTWGITNVSQGFNIIRATNPFGFHFKNLIGGGDIGAITYDNTTGENRFFNAAGGYFATFYANGNKLMELSTTGNVLVTNDLTVADEAYNATTWESSLEVPTKNAVRDKFESLVTGNGIYGGSGSLPSNVTVTTGGFTTTWSGSNDGETSFSVVNTGTTNASAISGTANGTTSTGVSGFASAYIGVFGSSTTNTGVQGQSSSGVGVVGASSTGAALRGQINPTSNNTIENVLTLLRTSSSGAGANGIGTAIPFELETATSGTSQTAGTIAFKFTDATNATRTSQFLITGVNNGTDNTLATFDGNGNATFGTTNSIVGTATNNNAVAGNIGEEVSSTISTYTNYTTTATYQNITSITLTPGDWDISAFMTYSSNSATITAGANAIFVISTTTASAAGATEGKNISYVPQAALLGTSLFSESISPYRVSISATTTYYLNTQATFTVGNPQYVGDIRARRMR